MQEDAGRVAEHMDALSHAITGDHLFHRVWGQQLRGEEEGFGPHCSPTLCTKAALVSTKHLSGREQI